MASHYLLCPICGERYVNPDEEMESYWECDGCGDQFDTETDALECENGHHEQEEDDGS